jgi:cell division protein ZapE
MTARGMGPLERYRAESSRPGFVRDPAQQQAAEALQALYDDLTAAAPRQRWLQSLLRRNIGDQARGILGLYLWGGVGRGKTYLMDLFYDAIPFEQKMRTHFHRFMQRIHHELRAEAGRKNPLQAIGRRIGGEARLLCFDEFFVSDITDAMILAGLFETLFAEGVTLVATSNVPPEELYKDGLQRQRFLPAIALIKRHTRVMRVDGGVDHRLRRLEQAELYHCPLDDGAEASLHSSLSSLAPETPVADQVLTIEGREIRARYCADDVVWFDFAEICDGPRSQNDYIELAREFHAVIVSDVPQFSTETEDQARRFISLVDEFYDRNVKLVVSAAAPPGELYRGVRLSFEFQRTVSRLIEMQSHAYLAREHRA